MSDHDKTHGDQTHEGHDDHGGPGHEVDKMPSGRLFNLLFGLSGLTLVACIGVVQLFYRQVDTIRDTRDAKLSFQLAEYRQEMDELKGGHVIEMVDDDGVPSAEGGRGVYDARRYQMPLSEARKRVLEQPQQRLKAGAPYKGWRTPDANAPKAVPRGPIPRNPVRPSPGADGKVVPGGAVVPGAVVPGAPGAVVPGAPGGMGVQPVVPTAPGRPAQPEGGEGKAKGETKAAEGKAAEGKAE